ncbi:TPA: hypothetical protein RVS72_002184 [Pasteurella multocida]|uniref:hypothetical protein n=1 Tax=Pasteurella multocida TaxID=747 RepID=UPI0028E05A6A|nr:hypothetical protein [Pasteurella multocida]HEA3280002.1 hypothetical protein [Pasteurella multocida]
MKQCIAFMAILALSLSTISEAKGGRGVRSSGHSRPVATKPAPAPKQTQTQQQSQQPDATFGQQNMQNTATNTPNNPNNRLASFATGAAAGYLLSEVLSPTEAQAQMATDQPLQPLNAQPNQSAVATFKALDQSNPAWVGMAGEQNLFCLNGALYLVNKNNHKIGAVTDNQAQAIACQVTQ